MRKRKENIIKIIIITLCILLSTTFVNALDVEKKVMKNNPISKDVYVEKNIHITKTKSFFLKQSLNQIQNPDVYKLIQSIINTAEDKGKASSYDIQEIINNLNLDSVQGVHIGFLEVYGPGSCVAAPGIIMNMILNIYMGPVILGTWTMTDNSSMDQKTSINFGMHEYSGPNKGYTFGGIGTFQNGYRPTIDFGIMGFFSLIVVTD